LSVLIIGELLIDLISKEYAKDLSQAESFERHFGGSPANIAMNLIDLGIKPFLISRVGNDSFGKAIIKRLKERKIEVKNIQFDRSEPTSMVLVSRSKKSPDFLPLRGADFRLEFPADASQLVKNVNFVHFSSWAISREPARSVTLRLLKMAKERRVKICFDPNYREILWEKGEDGRTFIKKLLKGIFLVKPSLDDARCLFGDMNEKKYVQIFHDLGVENVVLTLGEDGVIVSNGKEMRKFPSLAKKVVDSTGAGDAFWSGMYYALLKGKNVFEAAVFGSVAAAFRVETVGADAPLLPVEKLLKRYT